MKKFLIIMLVLCLAIAGVMGYFTAGEPQETEDGPKSGIPDLEAMYLSHRPDEVVAVIDGREILWQEYFYNLFTSIMDIQQQFGYFAQFGLELSWDDPDMQNADRSYAQAALDGTENKLLQYAAIRGFAKNNNVVLDEAVRAEMAQHRQEDIKTLVGEDAGEQEFKDYLAQIYMSPEMYDDMNELNYLFRRSYIQLYGENGELVTDEDAVSFLNETGNIYANHILISTVDAESGQELSEELLEEKKAQAEGIAAELMEIEDPEELLKRFGELKELHCEDPGKEHFPEGMVFTRGKMVQEFEDAAFALKEYQVSEPVKSQFGYHIIIRLPLDPDAVMSYTQTGTPVTVRGITANVRHGEGLDNYLAGLTVEYAQGFTKPEISDYIK